MKKDVSNKRWVAVPLVHKFSSREEWQRAAWETILTSPHILSLVVTTHERYDLVLRAAILDRLFSGKSYHEIEEELWASSQTISGIKKAINHDIYKSYTERSKKERKKRRYSSMPRPKIFRGKTFKTKYGRIRMPY